MTRRGTFLFIALSIIWGLPYLFIKYAIAEMDPVVVVFIRTAPSAVLLLLWSWKRGVLRANFRFWPTAAAFAGVEMLFPWWLITDAERNLSSGITGLLLATVPLFGVLIAKLRGDATATSPKRLLGMAIGIVGVILLVGINPTESKISFIPVLMVLVSAVGYAIGPAVINATLAEADSATVIGMSLAVVSVLYAPLALAHIPAQAPSAQGWFSIAVLSIVCTVAAFLCFFALIDEVGPIRATLVTYINPAVAVALGIVFLQEPITTGLILGFPLVLGGSWLASRK